MALTTAAPFGMSVKDQRAWVNFRRMRVVKDWLDAFPYLNEITVWWGERAYTKATRNGWKPKVEPPK